MKHCLTPGDICYYPAIGVCTVITTNHEQVGPHTVWHIELSRVRGHETYQPNVQLLRGLVPIKQYANPKLLRLLPAFLNASISDCVGTNDWYWHTHNRLYSSRLMNDLIESLREFNWLAVKNKLDKKQSDLHREVYNRVVDACSVVWNKSLPATIQKLDKQIGPQGLIRPASDLQNERAA